MVRDVGADSDHPHWRPGCVHDDPPVPTDPVCFPIWPDYANLGVILLLVFQGPLYLGLHAGQIVWMNGLEPGFQFAVKLLGSQPVDARNFVRPYQIVVLDVPVPRPHLRGFVGGGKTVQYGALRFLLQFGFRDVLDEDTDALRKWICTNLNPILPALAMTFKLYRYALGCAPAQLLFHRLADCALRQFPVIASYDLPLWLADKLRA